MWQCVLVLGAVLAVESPSPVATSQPVPDASEYLAVRSLLERVSSATAAEQSAQHEGALELSRKMLAYYESLPALGFTVTDVAADYDSNGKEAWRKGMIRARVHSQRGSVISEVHASSGKSYQPLWRFYLGQDSFGSFLQEFKYPWNGLPGQVAHIRQDTARAHLFTGVEQEYICDMAKFVRPWVGEEPWMITTWQRMIAGSQRGRLVALSNLINVSRLGSGLEQVMQAIVLPDLDSSGADTQWHVLYFNRQGLVLRRVLVNDYLNAKSRSRHRLRIFNYSNFSFEQLENGWDFDPPSELLKLVERDKWEQLDEDQAQRERRVALGQD